MKKAILDLSRRVSLAWLVLVLGIVVLEIFLVPYFIPTMTIQTPQEAKYLLPWKKTFNYTEFPVSIDLEVHDLVYPDRVTPYVNDPILYSFTITNLTNETLEINHTYSVVNPIFESFGNTSIKLDRNGTANLDNEEVVLMSEGINEIELVFNVTNSDEVLRIDHYLPAITEQTEYNILFGKYGEILTLIVLIPSTIIAIKNLKDIVIKSPDKEYSQSTF